MHVGNCDPVYSSEDDPIPEPRDFEIRYTDAKGILQVRKFTAHAAVIVHTEVVTETCLDCGNLHIVPKHHIHPACPHPYLWKAAALLMEAVEASEDAASPVILMEDLQKILPNFNLERPDDDTGR